MNSYSNANHEMEIINQLSNLSIEKHEIQIHETLLVQNKEKIVEAKLKELQQQKSVNVYEKVPEQGQDCISLRLLIKVKLVKNRKFIKVRLCARSLVEEQNFRANSPTCSREDHCLTCSMIASNKQTLNSLNVKTVFLQGKATERTLYVKPPEENSTNQIWKLQKCVYSLVDASRFWYFQLKEELIDLGTLSSTLDKEILIWTKEQEANSMFYKLCLLGRK